MKNKIIYIIMIIAVILGAIIVKVKGFNYGTLYSEHKRLEIIIGQDYNIDEVKKIVDETIKSNHVVRKATLYGTTLAIDAKDFKDDELNNLFTKLNEKYSKNYNTSDLRKEEIFKEMEIDSISDKTDDELTELISQIKDKYGISYTLEDLKNYTTKVRIYDVQEISVLDTIRGFLMPVVISLLIVMVYYGIRFFKLYKNAWILEPLKLAGKLILNQLFLLAIIAITRIPVSAYIPSLLLIIWVLQLVSETIKSETKLKEQKEEK